jgi:cytochrome P450
MYELINDQKLYQAVRAEAEEALRTDPETGKRTFDLEKLLSQPLLQSVYVEALRLNVCILITREVVQPTEMNGYKLKKGALLQAPTTLAHYDDNIWGKDGHKASEFWAERHVKKVTKVDEATGRETTVREFSLAARPSEFFPYGKFTSIRHALYYTANPLSLQIGGGISMCAGRFFVKREIILTMAMLVTRFDMEFIEWTDMDGVKSDRGPIHDKRFFGAAAVPPDRDARLRWKRLW